MLMHNISHENYLKHFSTNTVGSLHKLMRNDSYFCCFLGNKEVIRDGCFDFT